MRIREGGTIEEIARDERKDPKLIEASVKRGHQMFEADQNMRLRDAKFEGAIENERIRTDIRKKVGPLLTEAIMLLLKGEREIAETARDGTVTIHKYIDSEMVMAGIEAARKAISLEEKAGPNTIVNLQTNNIENPVLQTGPGLSFEEKLEKIHADQKRLGPAPVPAVRVPAADEPEAKPVDVEILDADGEEPLF